MVSPKRCLRNRGWDIVDVDVGWVERSVELNFTVSVLNGINLSIIMYGIPLSQTQWLYFGFGAFCYYR